MMTILEIQQKLETASKPCAGAIHKSAHCNVLAISFKKGMKLKDHQAHQASTLLVLTGEVLYQEADQKVRLTPFEQVSIPIDLTHSVEALEDSLCLLMQG